MFGRLIWTTLLAAAGYIAWRLLRGEQPPPVMYRPVEPAPAQSPPAQQPQITPEPIAASSESTPPIAASEADVASGSVDSAPEPIVEGSSTNNANNDTMPTEGVELEAYCMRCRTRRMISAAIPATTTNGRHGMRGSCTTCGAKVFTFVKEK